MSNSRLPQPHRTDAIRLGSATILRAVHIPAASGPVTGIAAPSIAPPTGARFSASTDVNARGTCGRATASFPAIADRCYPLGMDRRTIELGVAVAAPPVGGAMLLAPNLSPAQVWLAWALIIGGVAVAGLLWIISGRRQPAAKSGPIVETLTDNSIKNYAPNHGIQNTGIMISTDPPLSLSLDQKDWVYSWFEANGGGAGLVQIYGTGKASDAADDLRKYLLEKGLPHVGRVRQFLSNSFVARHGPIKISVLKGRPAGPPQTTIIALEA